MGLTASLHAGEMYERAGDIEHARQAYERQLKLWTSPDSTLAPLLETRARLARLPVRLETTRR